MEKLFPNVSPYEITNYSLPNLSYKTLKLMTLELKKNDIESKDILERKIILTKNIYSFLYLFTLLSISFFIKIKDKISLAAFPNYEN